MFSYYWDYCCKHGVGEHFRCNLLPPCSVLGDKPRDAAIGSSDRRRTHAHKAAATRPAAAPHACYGQRAPTPTLSQPQTKPAAPIAVAAQHQLYSCQRRYKYGHLNCQLIRTTSIPSSDHLKTADRQLRDVAGVDGVSAHLRVPYVCPHSNPMSRHCVVSATTQGQPFQIWHQWSQTKTREVPCLDCGIYRQRLTRM